MSFEGDARLKEEEACDWAAGFTFLVSKHKGTGGLMLWPLGACVKFEKLDG